MTKELFVAKTCARLWKILGKSPSLIRLEGNITGLWNRARILNHPYVQIDRGFVFIHVPKTAGTSLNKALGLKATLKTPLHSRYHDVMPFIKLLAPEVISLAFVRNPFSRFISLYNFSRADESLYHSTKNPENAPYGKHPDYDILSNKTLEECAELVIQGKLGDPRATTNNWRPQVEWLIDNTGQVKVDFIGHVESMEADLKRLEKEYGIKSQPVPWLNKSTENESAVELTERTCELIRSYYKRDFEMLGYSEEWPSRE